jgi:hypothetical protein
VSNCIVIIEFLVLRHFSFFRSGNSEVGFARTEPTGGNGEMAIAASFVGVFFELRRNGLCLFIDGKECHAKY